MLKIFCTCAVLFCSANAFAWQLDESAKKEYEALVAINKSALESWLSAVPDDSSGESFKQLARGASLFAENAPMMQQSDFSEYLSSFPSLFAEADTPKIPVGEKYTNDDLTLSGGKGRITFWLKTNFDSC